MSRTHLFSRHYLAIPAFLLFYGFSAALQAQMPPFYNWHRVAGSSTQDEISDLAADAAGNTFSVGFATNTIDFEPGTGNFILNVTAYAMFITKHDPTGQIAWVKSLGNGNNSLTPDCMTLDDAGNIYIAGQFSGTSIDYDPGPGIALVPGQGGGSGGQFILKLDANGNYVWARTIMGWNMNDIQVASDQSVYIAGEYFGGPNDFDPGPGQFLVAGGGNLGGFLLKLSPLGEFRWVYSMYNAENSSGLAVKISPSDAVYFLAYFGFIFDFAPGPPDATLTASSGYSDAVILKLDTAGTFQWVKQFTGLANETPTDLAIDAMENVLACGLTGGIYPMDLDPGPGVFQVTEEISFNTWVVSLDSSGDFRWGGILGGTGENRVERAAADASGNFYIAGRFSDSADFDPDTTARHWLSTPDHYDAFVTSIDPGGAFRWVKKTTGGNDDELPRGLAVSPDGQKIWMGGWYMETVDFDPGPGTHISGFNGGRDLFILHLGPDCLPAANSVFASACDSFVSFGGNVWNSTGIYVDSLLNAEACDSIVTVNLTVFQNDTAVSLSGGVLTSADTLGAWQWIDCATMTAIPGANQSTFTPTAIGSYAVILTEGFCTDTSACVLVNALSRAVTVGLPSFSLFPNPGRSDFTLTGIRNSKAVVVTVRNGLGEEIFSGRWESGSSFHLPLQVAAGMYWVTLESTEGPIWSRRLAVQ